jgi:DNA topoisomerase-6 subunit B
MGKEGGALKETFSEISPSDFFYRNRDLAGFTNPSRALYSTVRELVENSLDACELDTIPPEIYTRITQFDPRETEDPRKYLVRIQDNGPGVSPDYVPEAFGKVLYGSKYKLRQSRGMFGLGGTMAILYGQITSNRPVVIQTSFDGIKKYTFRLMIDIEKNKPLILEKKTEDANGKRGTIVELVVEGDYFRSAQKIQDYFKQTALVVPYADITFIDPVGRIFYYLKTTGEMPPPPKETLPHPHGIDVEFMRRMIRQSKEPYLVKYMSKRFHRVGEKTAIKFLQFAGFDQNRDPKSLSDEEIVNLVTSMHKYEEFLPPDADCLSPLGANIFSAGIIKELVPEFFTIVMRPPSAYSGFPFIVELALIYGGKMSDKGIKLYRFANRIPLLYDEASDISWKVINEEIDWKRYKIPQEAPIAVVVNISSTRIPYKTVGKEYLADRPELEKELKNALRETLRKLSAYLSRRTSEEHEKRKTNLYMKYLPLIANFSRELANKEKLPNYKRLLKEGQGEIAVEKEAEKIVEKEVAEEDNEKVEVIEGGQKKIEEFTVD